MTEEKKKADGKAGGGSVKDISKELKEKVKLALGVPLKDIPRYTVEKLVGELVDTILLVDDDGIVTEMNHLRSQLRRTQSELANLKKKKGITDPEEEQAKEEEAKRKAEEDKQIGEELALQSDRLRKVEKELKEKEGEIERLNKEAEENLALLNEGVDLYDALLAEKKSLQDKVKS